MKGILCIAWQIVSFLLFRTRQMRRLEELGRYDLVIVDEVHTVPFEGEGQ